MPNLTSTLTLKLTDDLSGPAKKAADALKAIGLSAQQVDKQMKLDGLRQAQTGFRQAATSFQQARERVRELATEFSAAQNPTKAMTRDLERARSTVKKTAAAFEEQRSVFRQARTALAELGTPLAQVANEEQRMRGAIQSATEAMERQAARAGSIGSRIKKGLGTAAAAAGSALAFPLMHGMKAGVKAGAELQSERVKLRAAGIPGSDIVKADAELARLAAQFPNVSRKDILERYKEARSVLLHPKEALTELPVITKTNAALNALEAGGKVEHGSAQGLGFALKGAEVMGLAQKPERLRSYLDAFVKAKQVMGGLITPEQIYDFATNVKGSGAMLSDRFIHTTAMSLTGELRGMRAGTGIDAFVKQITGGFQGAQHPALKEFVRLGLVNDADVDKTSTGSIKGLKPGGHVAGWKLAQTDPDKWVQQYLIPGMRQHGITDEQEQLALVKKIFTTSRAADIVTKLITQNESYQNHAKLMHDAVGLDATGLIKDDAIASLNSLTTSLTSFAATLTSPIMTSAAHVMDAVARGIGNVGTAIDEWQKNHPIRATAAAGVGIAGGLGVTGAAGYGLFSMLRSGFGLKGSAVALTGSAEALTAAAARLGVAGAASTGGGVARNVAAGAGVGLFPSLALPTAIAAAATVPFLIGYQNYQNNKKHPGWSATDVMQNNGDGDLGWGAGYAATAAANRGAGDYTLGSRGGFSKSGADGAWIPAPERSPFPGGANPASMFNYKELSVHSDEARSAGQDFGRAFREGFSDEMGKALSEANSAVSRLVSILAFSASPSITPQMAGWPASVGLSGGELDRGLHSDYGMVP